MNYQQIINRIPLACIKGNVYRSAGLFFFIIAVSILSSGCATKSADRLNTLNKQPPSAYKVAIINTSNQPINAIKFKPCLSSSAQYRRLTGNLRPMEKFTVNIYNRCVDFLATNAFKKKLADVKNVDLNSVKIWTIK